MQPTPPGNTRHAYGCPLSQLKLVSICEMCISNHRAVHILRIFKRIYHSYGLGHVVLLCSYVAFLLLSAAVFFVVESAYSTSVRSQWQHKLAHQRNRRLLLFIHDDKSQYLRGVVDDKLTHYEQHLKIRPPMPALPCTFTNALLFVCSTVSTIGYGYIYPVTKAGRYVSVCCALVGIPFTILIIKDLAYLLANLLNYPCVVLSVDETQLLRHIHGQRAVSRPDFSMDRLLDIPVVVAMLALGGWLGVGVVLVHVYLPAIDSSLAFYFIFNSLATIGVGDVDPGGLAVVSLFINLLHTKFRMYMPLSTQPLPELASFDSYSDQLNNISDCPLTHYVTLGVLQTDDKCPLIGAIRKERAYQDADTQTAAGSVVRLCAAASPEAVLLHPPFSTSSRDDVNDLIVETYGGRAARLI